MINIYEVNETNQMIEQENLDVRTITMGISLLSCAAEDMDRNTSPVSGLRNFMLVLLVHASAAVGAVVQDGNC